MRRAEKDIEGLLAEGIRIRLCKGAYKEPDEIAFQKKSEVDANYVRLMKVLLKSGVYHGLATHDEADHSASQSLRHAGKYLRLTPLSSKCFTDSPRPAATSGARRMAHAGLHSVRHGVVSLFHAPPGGTAGERIFHRQKFVARLNDRASLSVPGPMRLIFKP